MTAITYVAAGTYVVCSDFEGPSWTFDMVAPHDQQGGFAVARIIDATGLDYTTRVQTTTRDGQANCGAVGSQPGTDFVAIAASHSGSIGFENPAETHPNASTELLNILLNPDGSRTGYGVLGVQSNLTGPFASLPLKGMPTMGAAIADSGEMFAGAISFEVNRPTMPIPTTGFAGFVKSFINVGGADYQSVELFDGPDAQAVMTMHHRTTSQLTAIGGSFQNTVQFPFMSESAAGLSDGFWVVYDPPGPIAEN